MSDDRVRRLVGRLLRESGAHAGLRRALESFPSERAGERPEGLPHSAWELVEHLRLATEDLRTYAVSKDYEAPEWPDDYWPPTEAPPGAEAWEASVRALLDEIDTMAALVEDPERDLWGAAPTGPGDHHLLRNALLVLDHTSYHVGQLVTLRRALGEW